MKINEAKKIPLPVKVRGNPSSQKGKPSQVCVHVVIRIANPVGESRERELLRGQEQQQHPREPEVRACVRFRCSVCVRLGGAVRGKDKGKEGRV